MKQYVIDQLRPGDHQTLKDHLDETYGDSGVDGVYWIPLDESFLEEVQAGHKDCQPHYFAVELDLNSLSCELLIRSLSRMRCDCIRYATPRQVMGIIAFVDEMLEQLDIHT